MESFFPLEKYMKWLEGQLTDIVRNPNHRVMELNMSTIIGRTPHIGVGVSNHMKVHYQFTTMFLKAIKKFYILTRHFKV